MLSCSDAFLIESSSLCERVTSAYIFGTFLRARAILVLYYLLVLVAIVLAGHRVALKVHVTTLPPGGRLLLLLRLHLAHALDLWVILLLYLLPLLLLRLLLRLQDFFFGWIS